MVEEDYVSFEIAKLLKEKGFKGQGEHFYEDNKITNFINYWRKITPEQRYEAIEAPTLQMAMKWLREVYNIHIEVEVYYCEDGQMWLAKIQKIESANTILVKTCMVNSTYEEAVESVIKYCLENLI